MTIRALIVDDEAPARGELRFLLSAHPEVEVAGEAGSAAEALSLAASSTYDVVFLDIELPRLSGLEAARLIREGTPRPELVFVTAHERYAVEAFAVEAADYLLKPVDPGRLARAVQRLAERRRGAPGEPGRLAVVGPPGETALVEYDAIHHVVADGDYSRIHTFERSYLCTASLREVEAALPGERFLRIHRSHLVNLAKVASVKRVAGERLRLVLDDAGRTELDVARRQTRDVREKLRL